MKLELRNVSLQYSGKSPLFRDVSFALDHGDFLLIRGPSGSGKSSLLRLINRLQEPTSSDPLTVGLVSLPGMMTGQILAGSPPLTAIRYQIMVMLMLVAATAIGSIIVVHVVRRLCFTHAHQMVV